MRPCATYISVDMDNLDAVIEGCKQGNRVMQKKLYDLYGPRFYALCRRYSADADEANDMFTDGFITVYAKIVDYRGDGSFEGWMHSVFVRTAIRYYRDNSRHHRHFEPMGDQDFNGENIDLPSQIDIKDALLYAVQKLDESEKMIFNLVAVEGYSLNEVAEEMDMPLSTAKSRYYKALKQLKIILTKRLGSKFLEKYK